MARRYRIRAGGRIVETFDDMSMAELAAEWGRLMAVVAALDVKIERAANYRARVVARRDDVARAASVLSMKGGE